MKAAGQGAGTRSLAEPPHWPVFLTARAERDLAQIAEHDQIREALLKLAAGEGDIRKLSPGLPGLSGYENIWRLRVGDWRVLYQPTNRQITVLAIRHGRDAYKKR